ncbi:hypothetical protein Hanom_Chr16g01449321 [Helianthus anomalus]
MVNVQEDAENDVVMEEAADEEIHELAENEEVHEPEFLMVGEPVEPVILENVLRDVQVMQRRRRAREVLLLEYTTDKFVLVGKAYSVPYNGKEVAKLSKFFELKKRG